MRRTRLLPVLAIAALGLAGCSGAGDDTAQPDQPTTADGATANADPTETVSASPEDDEPARGDTGDEPVAGQTSPAPTDGGTPTDGEVVTPDEDRPVVLAFDGRPVPLATTCAGVDGAILATTEGEVTVTLVQEETVSLRYQAEGTSAETDDVTVDDTEDETIYSATLSSDQVEPLAVTMTVASGAVDRLPDCE